MKKIALSFKLFRNSKNSAASIIWLGIGLLTYMVGSGAIYAAKLILADKVDLRSNRSVPLDWNLASSGQVLELGEGFSGELIKLNVRLSNNTLNEQSISYYRASCNCLDVSAMPTNAVLLPSQTTTSQIALFWGGMEGRKTVGLSAFDSNGKVISKINISGKVNYAIDNLSPIVKMIAVDNSVKTQGELIIKTRNCWLGELGLDLPVLYKNALVAERINNPLPDSNYVIKLYYNGKYGDLYLRDIPILSQGRAIGSIDLVSTIERGQ